MDDSHEHLIGELGDLGRRLTDYIQTGHDRGRAVLVQPPMRELAERLRIDHWTTHGGLQGAELDAFFGTYLDHTTHLHHPGYLAHQVSTPTVRTALGHLVDGITNNGMSIYEMGPAAATMEYAMVNWMLAHVGWTPRPWPDAVSDAAPHGGGLLTHGGSLANLTALLAARAHVFPHAWRDGYAQKPVILAPGNNHYSIERAAGIMGMGTDALRLCPTDAHGVLLPDRIADTYRRAVDAGEVPIALVANACATAAGLYDPLEAVAAVCGDLGLWLHVDGAHGAGALVSPRHRGLLAGIEAADSLVWDAHKLLATPALCAAVLVKDDRTLSRNFQQDASYLFHEKDEPGFDFITRTVECTKAALGLRFFLTVAGMGEAGLADHVAHLHDLTQTAYRLLDAHPAFTVPVAPQSNILCFRYGDDDALQLRLRTRLLREGAYYLGATLFAGRRHLRIVVMNPRTTQADLEGLIARIEALAPLCAAEDAP